MSGHEKQNDNSVILSYVGMDESYLNGNLMYIAGKEDVTAGNVGTLQSPQLGFAVDPAEPDPVSFSYIYTDRAGNRNLRQLLAKINNAPSSTPLPAKYTVLQPAPEGAWKSASADFTLVDANGTVVSFNPHALAQVGNALYIADYQSGLLVVTGADALEAAQSGAPLEVTAVDLSGFLPSRNGGAQALIAVEGYLYILFIDKSYPPTTPSMLLQLDLSSGTPTPTRNRTQVGFNAQAIIPVRDAKNVLWLLVPSIGGAQDYNGKTNGVNSNIYAIPVDNFAGRVIKLTGDSAVTPPTAYDIHTLGAAMRNGESVIYILTQLYDDDGATAFWRVYQTTVTEFFGFPTAGTITDAVSSGDLRLVDEGVVQSPDYSGIVMWDLLYEQTPDPADDSGDRVWFCRGAPILATRAAAYGSPTAIGGHSPYALFGFIGGANVNMGSIDLTIETLNQAKRGVSLKRGFRKAAAPRPAEEEGNAKN
jgi:hypothetical protein